jgi:hypothetical protein
MIVSEISRVTSTDIGDRRHLNSCERGTNIESQLQHINLAHLLIMRSIARPKRSLKLSQRKSLEHSCTSGSYVASGESLAANLTVHIKNPRGFNQRCDFAGCIDQTVYYTSADRLRDHHGEHHIYDYSKFTCPIDTCPQVQEPTGIGAVSSHAHGRHAWNIC